MAIINSNSMFTVLKEDGTVSLFVKEKDSLTEYTDIKLCSVELVNAKEIVGETATFYYSKPTKIIKKGE